MIAFNESGGMIGISMTDQQTNIENLTWDEYYTSISYWNSSNTLTTCLTVYCDSTNRKDWFIDDLSICYECYDSECPTCDVPEDVPDGECSIM